MAKRSLRAAILPLLPVLAGLLAFGGAADHGFVYDDHPSIVDNRGIRAGDPLAAAFGEEHSPVANRPLTCVTLAANHAVHGLEPAGYHLINLALHLLNSLLVLAVVHGCLLAPNLRGAWSELRAHGIATVVATLWASHPLLTDAVVYVTQRTTLLMSGALLVALLAVLRAANSPRPGAWRAAAVIAVALGMASKEEMVAAPLLLVLFERAFVLPDWASMRWRWRFHLALAATWLVLIACVWAGPGNPTVGYDTQPRASAFEWLMTEAPVLVHYLRLSVWPEPLRGVYAWPIVRDPSAAVLPGLVVLALLAVTALLWLRRQRWGPALGWLGALFFLLLAPTSSVLPIVTEVAAERRMYLPSLAVLVPVVFGAERLLRGRPIVSVVAAMVAVALAVATARGHVPTYRDDAAFWSDAYAKMEPGNRAFLAGLVLSGYGKVLHEQGRVTEAHELFALSMTCEAPTPVQRLRFAIALAEQGRVQEAEAKLVALLREDPDLAAGNLAALLLQSALAEGSDPAALSRNPRIVKAEELLRRAIERRPWKAGHHNSLGYLLYRLDHHARAEKHLRKAIALEPERALPRMNLGLVLAALGRDAEAVAEWRVLLPVMPRNVALRLNLARAYARLQDRAAARAMLQAVLRIDPENAAAKDLIEALRRVR